MSLLMDALKKAEKARQAEAAKSAGEPDDIETQELSLDPLIEPQRADLDAPISLLPDDDATIEAEAPNLDDLSLTDALEETEEDLLLTRERQMPSPFPRPGESPPSGSPAGDDTSATLPSMKMTQRDLDRYFADTQTGEQAQVSADDEVGGDDNEATVLSDRASLDWSAQRAAQNMFVAKTGRVGRRGGWLLYAALPLALLALAAGAYYYWPTLMGGSSIVSRTPPPAAPLGVSGSSASTAEQAPIGAPASVAETSAQAPVDEVAMSQAGASTDTSVAVARDFVAEAGAPRVTVEPPTQGDLTTISAMPAADAPASGQSAASQAAAAAPDSARAEDAAVTQRAAADPSSTATRSVADDTEQARSPNNGTASSAPPPLPQGVTRTSQIQISRARSVNRVHAGLTQAYDAFQRGDDVTAGRLYQRVIRMHPNNRDALLGVGAVLARAERWEQAAQVYGKLLRLNPRDSVAQAALVGMQRNLDPVAAESRIKSLLAREPDAPHLHFSLGNLYAAESRWPEAQEAYFNAYRANSNNADYAFNLAVSLDHLSQSSAALTYYVRAAELSDAQPRAGFDTAAAFRRINAIQGAGIVQ